MGKNRRDRFEEWARKEGLVLAFVAGHYHESDTQYAWLAWQAATDSLMNVLKGLYQPFLWAHGHVTAIVPKGVVEAAGAIIVEMDET